MSNIHEQFKDETLTIDKKSEFLTKLTDKELKELYIDCEYPILQDKWTEEEDQIYIFITNWIEENKGVDYLSSM